MIESFTPADQGNILDELREPTHLRGFTTRERRDSDFKRITEIDSTESKEESKQSATTAQFRYYS